jgi:ABC-type nitrate/sulfonate/bicarbonate transport system substrate-binding protein
MDQQEQERINRAAEEFTDALVQAQRIASEHGVNAQEQNARLTEDFFNRVIENMRTQAEENRQITEQLADQQQRAAEAGQQLTQESVNAYMAFVNSMFSFAQQGPEAARGGTERAAREAGTGGGGGS